MESYAGELSEEWYSKCDINKNKNGMEVNVDIILEKLSKIKSYRKIISDAEQEIARLLLDIEFEVYKRDGIKQYSVTTHNKRTPEIEKFFDSIDKMFGKEN